MEGRDENKYFHSKASDEREPYKNWLAKNAPGRSFAEVPYVYADSPEKPLQPYLPTLPFRRDRLQVGFDVTDGWHGMDGDSDWVPYGFHAVPDTDYEFSLYGSRRQERTLASSGAGCAAHTRLSAPAAREENDWSCERGAPRGQA